MIRFFKRFSNINDIVYYIGQAFGLVYITLCVFWLVYVTAKIFVQFKNRRRLMSLMRYDEVDYYGHKILTKNENIFRNILFLMYLLCEVIFFTNVESFGIVISNMSHSNISIGYNCSFGPDTFIGMFYANRMNNVVFLFDIFSFSMMIWLFGASLLHLGFAARNELRVKNVTLYIFFGVIINLLCILPIVIPYISVFVNISHTLVDQINIFVVVYIAKNKFFPAMNSRVIDAYHSSTTNVVYLQQQKLYRAYRTLVYFVVIVFELYVLKNMIFYNLYTILESISLNSCWFHVTYNLPTLQLSEHTNDIFSQLSSFMIDIVHLIDLMIYCSFIILNLNFICIIFKRFFKKTQYRYQIFSAPLLSDYN